MLFFASLTPFRGPRATKECQKESQSEQKSGRNAFCGTCENHAIYCTGATWGPPGEGPETIFFQSALRRGSGKHLEEDLGGLFEILVFFGGPWETNFQKKSRFFSGLIFDRFLNHF